MAERRVNIFEHFGDPERQTGRGQRLYRAHWDDKSGNIVFAIRLGVPVFDDGHFNPTVRATVEEVLRHHPDAKCYRLDRLVKLPVRDSANVLQLKKSLFAGDRGVLGPLADAYEEEGRTKEPMAYRWLLNNGKWPSPPGTFVPPTPGALGSYDWWPAPGQPTTGRCRPDANGQVVQSLCEDEIPLEAGLPRSVYSRLRNGGYYRSLKAALLDAVKAIIAEDRDCYGKSAALNWRNGC